MVRRAFLKNFFCAIFFLALLGAASAEVALSHRDFDINYFYVVKSGAVSRALDSNEFGAVSASLLDGNVVGTAKVHVASPSDAASSQDARISPPLNPPVLESVQAKAIQGAPRGVVEQGSLPDVSKGDYNSSDFEAKNKLQLNHRKAFPVPGNRDGNSIGPMGVSAQTDRSCLLATSDLWSYYYTDYLSYSGDAHWFKGYRIGTNTLRFVLIPPNNKDYDIEIYDSCGSSYVKKCNAGSGQMENCTATVNGDYYVKVYGYNDAYSTISSYKLFSRGSGSCDESISGGTNSKSTYLCNDTITVNNTSVSNNNSTSMSYKLYNDLYTANNNYFNETTLSDAQNLSAGYYQNWNTSFPAPLSGGWPDSGSYSMRSFAIAWCNGYNDLQVVATSVSPNVSCTAGSILGFDGSPNKSSYACNDNIVSQNHRFTNSSNTYTYNYTIYYQLKDPYGNVISSGSTANLSIAPGNTAAWDATFTPGSDGWPMSGVYAVKVWADGSFSDGRSATANTFSNPSVPNAPCRGEVTSVSANPTKRVYSCSEDFGSNHVFSNTGTMNFNYDYLGELYDPDGLFLGSASKSSQSLSAGSSIDWGLTSSPGTYGNWTKVGNYTHKVTLTGKFSNGTASTHSSSANLYVETACAGDTIGGADGTPDKTSYACDGTIISDNHLFSNTSKLYTFNYVFNYELKDPNGNVVYSGQDPDAWTLGPQKQVGWKVTLPSPSGGWPGSGDYTLKTWVSGAYTDGRSRTTYSFSSPYVPSAPCQKDCRVVSYSAWIEQDGLCSSNIIAKHEFTNNGTRVYPHSANFYLYDSSNNIVNSGSNSYSTKPGDSVVWTVTWPTPSGGWKPGAYRSEAQLSGNCVGGGTASASNSVDASIPSSCSSTCSGTINANVRDNSSNNIPNAKVYLDGSYKSDTDSGGNISLGVSDQSCGRTHNVAVYCSNGTYCDTKTASIGSDGGSQQLNFGCGVCSQSQNLSTSITSNGSYLLNDSINLEITVRDGVGSLVDSASLSIYDPFRGTSVSRSTSNGRYTYSTTASKTGAQTFTVSASKSGYNGVSASKVVSVGQQLATIYVSVSNSDGSSLAGANLYLDNSYEGTTDNSGRKTLTTPAGSHSVEVKCPTLESCSSESGYFSGLKNVNFSCNCDVDADDDGLTNSEEELIGSGPHDASSNLATVMAKVNSNTTCLELLSGHIGPLSGQQKSKLVGNLKAMNYQKLVSVASKDRVVVQKALEGTGISPLEMKTSTMTLKEFIEDSRSMEAFESSDGTVIVLSVREDGATDFTNIGPSCKGFFIGLPNGGFAGIKGDIDAAGQVLKGMWWAVWHLNELPGIAGNVGKFIFGLEFLKAFDEPGKIIKSITLDVLREAKKWNTYGKGTDEFPAFQFGFMDGYVSGYLIEQVGILFVGVGEVSDVLKGIRIGGRGAELAEKAYLAFTRIGEKFGAKTAEALKLFKTPVLSEWSLEAAQNFAARTAKLFSKTDDADKWLASLGSRAEEVAAKGERTTQKLAAELGSEEAAEKAMSKLINSEFGKKALAEWSSEGAIKQYAKMFGKYEISGQESITRLSTKFSGETLEPVMKNLEELSKVPGLKGFENLEKRIARSTESDGQGFFAEAKRASALSKQDNVVLREVETETEPIAYKWRGDTYTDAWEKDISYDFTSGGQTKRIVEEVKSKSGPRTVIQLDDKGEKQLYKMAEGIKKGFADEARIVSPSGLTFDDNYKRVAEQLGIIVREGAT
ncbi:Uncharacterised protein [uncultured archaeon]|nr:Uncharacterised protein [uncultured archaeon]